MEPGGKATWMVIFVCNRGVHVIVIHKMSVKLKYTILVSTFHGSLGLRLANREGYYWMGLPSAGWKSWIIVWCIHKEAPWVIAWNCLPMMTYNLTTNTTQWEWGKIISLNYFPVIGLLLVSWCSKGVTLTVKRRPLTVRLLSLLQTSWARSLPFSRSPVITKLSWLCKWKRRLQV